VADRATAGATKGTVLALSDPRNVLPAEWWARLAAIEAVPVSSGKSGAGVFRIVGRQTGEQYLKIATGPDAAQLRHEAERTKWLAAMGTRVPRVIATFDDEDGFAVAMAALDGESAENADPRDGRRVAAAIGSAFARLHALPLSTCPFDEGVAVRLARAGALIERGAIDGSDFDARNAAVAPADLYRRLAAGVPAPEDWVVVHGDATLSNLIVGRDESIGFIDCGNCGRADRYVDLALLAGELAESFGDDARGAFLQAYGRLEWDEYKAEFYRDLYELF
jgi:aminoglycoside 3'-phosphotransferase II